MSHLAPWRRTATALAALTLAATAGCVFDSPYWAQTFASTTTPVPIQTWVMNRTAPVVIECSPAYHGGLYPWGGPETWLPVTSLTPSTQASYDPSGTVTYSAGTSMSLPAGCWHADDAYTPAKYMTALRARQTIGSTTTTFNVFDTTGLECLGREIGKGRSWVAWLGKGCALTYSGSTTAIPYVRIIANALGSGAMAARSLAPAPMAGAAAPAKALKADTGAAQAAVVAASFEAQPVDTAWSAETEARLRMALDGASGAGAQVAAMACRSTMCRIEVTHDGATGAGGFLARIATSGLFSNDGQRGLMVESSRTQAVYYLAREGQKLPTP